MGTYAATGVGTGTRIARTRLGTGIAVAVLALAAALVPASEPAIAQTESACPEDVPSAGFQDVDASSPHAAAVDCVAWWNITRGVSPDRFAPARTVPRDQLAAFVARLLRVPGGELPASPDDRFRDDRESLHHFAINRLATTDVVRGVGGSAFAPSRTTSRGQVASVLADAYRQRTGRSLEPGDRTFRDISDSVHRTNIEALAAVGIVEGTGRGRFGPNDPLTRAQLASLMARTLELLAEEGELEDTPRTLRAASDLRDFTSCDDLLGHLKERALEDARVVHDGPGAVPSPESPVSGGDADGEADGGGTPPPEMPEHSDTNVQEQGVDEPDLVKTDGSRVFVATDGVLRALDVTGDEPRLVGDLALGGAWGGHELLLHEDRLLVMGTQRSEEHGGTVAVLQVLDVSDPAAIVVEHTYDIDGRVLSARLVDGVARVVVRSEPDVLRSYGGAEPAPADDGAAAQSHDGNAYTDTDLRLRIENSTLEDWLPGLRGEGRDEPLLDCSTLTHPPEFSGLGTLAVVTVDLRTGDLVDGATRGVLASGEIVYASRGGVYVATARWEQWGVSGADAAVTGPSTEIHAFGTDVPDATTYRGSGKVPGWVLNQFSLSEHEGNLRIATTTEPPWDAAGESESYVTVLTLEGDALVPVGQVGGLGRGERIYAVRFMGDMGYVVTFRQVDPLYVVDLSDPRNPAVRGELKILGYSAYLHPVGEGLLLGVGQDATEDGQTTGTQLSLFDVSDPARPERLHSTSVADAHSEVEWDHRAFLWWAPERLAVLPLQTWSEEDSFLGAVGWTVDESSGFAERGRVSHSDKATDAGPEEPEYDTNIRRSLVVGDQLLTLSARGLLASDLGTFDEVAWVPFE